MTSRIAGRWMHGTAFLCVAFGAAVWGVGCEKKEKILDVETPGGGIEINRTGEDLDIEIKNDEESKKIRIDIEENGTVE